MTGLYRKQSAPATDLKLDQFFLKLPRAERTDGPAFCHGLGLCFLEFCPIFIELLLLSFLVHEGDYRA